MARTARNSEPSATKWYVHKGLFGVERVVASDDPLQVLLNVCCRGPPEELLPQFLFKHCVGIVRELCMW